MIIQPERVPFEERNVEGYRLVLYVEVALREIAKNEYEKTYGHDWQKRIPGQLLRRIRDDQKDEQKHASLDFRRLGPLYYLTFGEIVDLAAQKPVVEVVRAILGQHGLELIKELILPRNSLAHCRDLSHAALTTLRTVSSRMESGLTACGLSGLLKNPDVGLYPEDAAVSLGSWLGATLTDIEHIRAVSSSDRDYRAAASQYWWSSTDLAGFDVAMVNSVANKLRQYQRLPGGVGAAAARQHFLEQSGLLNELQQAIQMLEAVK